MKLVLLNIILTRNFSVYFNLGPWSSGIGKFVAFYVTLGVFTVVIYLQTVAQHGSTMYLFVHYHTLEIVRNSHL